MYEWFQKNKKILTYIYLALLIFGFFFVRKALNTEDIKVDEKVEETAEEIKPVKVTLAVWDSYGNETKYEARLKNEDSVLDLLEELRDNEGFWFEKVAYTYGFEIENVNYLTLEEGMRWGVYSSASKKDISYEIGNYKLSDGEAFLIQPVEISTTTRSEVQQ